MSASSLHRHLECAGSREAEYGLPSPPPSERQLQGDEAHEALRHVLDGSLQLSAVEDSLRPHIKVAVDYVLDITRQGGWALSVEHEVDPVLQFGETGHGGSCDIMLVKDDHLIIIDYKHGESREVLALGNKQLLAYAAGAVRETKSKIERIDLVIIQPRIWFGPTIKGWRLPIALAEYEWTLIRSQLELIKGSSIKSPSDKACFGCRAAIVCGARLKHIEEVTMEAQEQVNGPGVGIKGLSDANIAAFLDTHASMKSVYADIEDEARLRIKAGKIIPGWKLVAGRGSRKWIHDQDVMEKKLKNMKVPKAQYLVASLVSPAQAEKLECLSSKQLKNLKGLITTSTGQPKMVTESTTGDAIVYDSGAAFADLDTTAPEAVVIEPVNPSTLFI